MLSNTSWQIAAIKKAGQFPDPLFCRLQPIKSASAKSSTDRQTAGWTPGG